MIYNFQQVIAIGIALKSEEESLHKTKPVCDGVLCLQLLYGAVVYRAQHTIHHVLGDLSLSKQSSRDLPTPVTPYTTSNPLLLDPESVEPPASLPINIRNPTAVRLVSQESVDTPTDNSTTGQTTDETFDDSEVEELREAMRRPHPVMMGEDGMGGSEFNMDGPPEFVIDMAQLRRLRGLDEEEGGDGTDEEGEMESEDEGDGEGRRQRRTDINRAQDNDSENTESLPSASDILLPLLAMEGSLGLDDLDDDEDREDDFDRAEDENGTERGDDTPAPGEDGDEGEGGERRTGRVSHDDPPDDRVRFLRLFAGKICFLYSSPSRPFSPVFIPTSLHHSYLLFLIR
eukprot:sb/3466357/